MKKITFLSIVLMLTFLLSVAQNDRVKTPHFQSSQYSKIERSDDDNIEFDYLDINNIKAYINPLLLFSRKNQEDGKNQASFEAPQNSGKHSIFTSNIWLGGLDEQDNLHVAAHRFCQVGNDFWLGPVTNDYEMKNDENIVSDAYRQKYHHTWKVSKEEIEYHKAHYADLDYVMPWSISHWPAHGRPEYGESTHLAPYKNVSGKSQYSPQLGDYPDILGDQAVYFIINDALNEHTESGGTVFGLEILCMVYAYNSPDSALQNTLFLSYTLRNRSENNYKDFYFGFWSDFDIGVPLDDYVGCDTSLNLAFGYNATPIDGEETDSFYEVQAYGENPPAQGIMFLNQKMSAFVYHNNDGSATGDPIMAEHYYNYLRAIWKDNQKLRYGGDGHPSGGGTGEECNFMFSGDPVTGTGWTEMGVGNRPWDRRGMMSAGSFTLQAEETISVDLALPFARDYQGDNISSVALLKQYAQSIQQFYNRNDTTISGNVVYSNQTPFHSGNVLLYSIQNNEQYVVSNTIRLSNNGSYAFENVEDGNYIIKVIPDNTENVLPVYYENSEFWKEATVITIAQHTPVQNVPITVMSIEPLDGNSTISGYVGKENNGKRTISKSEVSHPVPNVNVYLQSLQNDEWKTIAHTITNEDGYFVFWNVPQGTYRVMLDIVGLEMTDPAVVEITNDGEIVDDIGFEITNDGIYTVSIVETRHATSLQVYPNPTDGQLKIESGKLKIESVEIFDITGRKLLSHPLSTFNFPLSTQIDISHLSAGVYFLRVGGEMVKVVKN